MGFGSKRKSEKNSMVACTSPGDWSKEHKEMRALDNLLRCPICFDFYKIAMMIPGCSHNYCSLCIKKYLLFKRQCPTCTIPLTDSMLKNNRLLDEIVAKFVIIRSSFIGKWQENSVEQKVAKNIDVPSPKRLKAFKKTSNSIKGLTTKTAKKKSTKNDKDDVVYIESKPFLSDSPSSVKQESDKPFSELKQCASLKSPTHSKAWSNESKLPKTEKFESMLTIANSGSDSKLLVDLKISVMESNPDDFFIESEPLPPEPKPSTSGQSSECSSLSTHEKKTQINDNQSVEILDICNSEDFIENHLKMNTLNNSKKSQRKSFRKSLKGKGVISNFQSLQGSLSTSSTSLFTQPPAKEEIKDNQKIYFPNTSSFIDDTKNTLKNEPTTLKNESTTSSTSSPRHHPFTPTMDHHKVGCPVCGIMINSGQINSHLDLCLSSGEKREALRKKRRQQTSQERKPMLKLVYSLLSEKDLKKKVKEVGLSTEGERRELVRRHQELTLAYNAQCDSLHPKSVKDLVSEVDKNERLKAHLTSNLHQDQRLHFDKNSTESKIQEAKVYVKKHKKQFKELIRAARKRMGAKQQKSLRTITTLKDDRQDTDNSQTVNISMPCGDDNSYDNVQYCKSDDNVQCVNIEKSKDIQVIDHCETKATNHQGIDSIPVMDPKTAISLDKLSVPDEATTDLHVQDEPLNTPHTNIVLYPDKLTQLGTDPAECIGPNSENIGELSTAALDTEVIGDSWPPLTQQTRSGSASGSSDSANSSPLLCFLDCGQLE